MRQRAPCGLELAVVRQYGGDLIAVHQGDGGLEVDGVESADLGRVDS